MAQVLANPLSSWPRLEQLNLAGNALLQGSVQVLVQDGLVPRQKNAAASPVAILQLLDLSSTKCPVEAAYIAICQAHVKQLRWFDNQLGSSGFAELAAKLSDGASISPNGIVAPTLECLDLAGNGASQEAVVALLRALLQLPTNNGNDDNKQSTAFLKGSSLKTIIVGGNQGGDDLEALVREIEQVRPDVDIAEQESGIIHTS